MHFTINNVLHLLVFLSFQTVNKETLIWSRCFQQWEKNKSKLLWGDIVMWIFLSSVEHFMDLIVSRPIMKVKICWWWQPDLKQKQNQHWNFSQIKIQSLSCVLFVQNVFLNLSRLSNVLVTEAVFLFFFLTMCLLTF